MKKMKNINDKNKEKIKTRIIVFISLSIVILLFGIYKIVINYQLKKELEAQVVAVVRFNFTGLKNMFHNKYEYYAITKNNKAIRISRDDMNKYNNNYSDSNNIFELAKDNTYMLLCDNGQIRDHFHYFNFLNSNEIKSIETKTNKIYEILQDSYGEDFFTLYTDKNSYIVEIESNSSSTIYRYVDEKLIKVLDVPNGTFYYIYFVK